MQKIQIVKLTSKQSVDVHPTSIPSVFVNECISIPSNAYGKFFLRKKWVSQGLIAPDLPFHPNWTCNKPEVYVQNKSDRYIEIRKDEEVGELWIYHNIEFIGEDK